MESLDIFEKVGRFAAYDEYIEFEYTLGQIFFKVGKYVINVRSRELLAWKRYKEDNY